MTRSDRLRAHIDSVIDLPAEIGKDDCGPWVVQWIEKEAGRKIDFPRYQTPEEAYAMAARAGGLVALVEPLLACANIWPTASPVVGDVGIVGLSNRETAVIFCGNDLAVVRNIKGGAIYFRPKSVLKAWLLP